MSDTVASQGRAVMKHSIAVAGVSILFLACGSGTEGGTDSGPTDAISTDTQPDTTETCPAFTVKFDSACVVSDWYPPEDDTLSSYRSQKVFTPGAEPMLHIIGVHETTKEKKPFRASEPMGQAVVHIGPTLRPLVLGLSSGDPTEWFLNLAPGARLDKIVIHGNKEQLLHPPLGVEVINLLAGDMDSLSGYSWPYHGGTQVMVAEIELATGLTVEAFDGCYYMNEMTISHVCSEECALEVACAPYECGRVDDCDLDCGPCPDGEGCLHHLCHECSPSCAGKECGPDGCGATCGSCPQDKACSSEGKCIDEVAAVIEKGWTCIIGVDESHHCLALTYIGAALIGVDSEHLCPVGPQNGLLGSSSNHGIDSIAWMGEYVYVCNGQGMVRVSLLDGSWDWAGMSSCEGVAGWKGGLLVDVGNFANPTPPPPGEKHPRLVFHDSFEDIKKDNGLPLEFVPGLLSRFTVQGDTLYTAWHSTDKVYKYSLPDGEELGVIQLEEYDGWVRGMSVTEDGLLVLNTWSHDQGVLVFDVETGQQLSELYNLHVPRAVPWELKGMVCVTNGANSP